MSAEPFHLTPPEDAPLGDNWPSHIMAHQVPRPLRQRSLYWRPAGEWVGFGPDRNDQPDLFESVYRFGWWRVAVCRVCLVAAIKNASAFLDQAEALLTQQRKRTH